MADAVEFVWTGARDCVAGIDKAIATYEKEILDTFMQELGAVMVAEIAARQDQTPKDGRESKRTGALKRSVRFEHRRVGDETIVRAGATLPYARRQDLGYKGRGRTGRGHNPTPGSHAVAEAYVALLPKIATFMSLKFNPARTWG